MLRLFTFSKALGLFCGNIGFFCGNIGFFCGKIEVIVGKACQSYMHTYVETFPFLESTQRFCNRGCTRDNARNTFAKEACFCKRGMYMYMCTYVCWDFPLSRKHPMIRYKRLKKKQHAPILLQKRHVSAKEACIYICICVRMYVETFPFLESTQCFRKRGCKAPNISAKQACFCKRGMYIYIYIYMYICMLRLSPFSKAPNDSVQEAEKEATRPNISAKEVCCCKRGMYIYIHIYTHICWDFSLSRKRPMFLKNRQRPACVSTLGIFYERYVNHACLKHRQGSASFAETLASFAETLASYAEILST